MIKFLLNDNEIAVEEINPNISLLEYLREEVYLTGTKEGCASGDCGACTVVTSKLDVDNASLQYESINACIVSLGSLHGRQIITVEHLQHHEALHNCQRAMASNHGSQCGFCTPGFVMSLFSYLKNNENPAREKILEALSGNLCRCTGYKSIIAAAFSMYEDYIGDQFDASKGTTIKKLAQIKAECSSAFLSLHNQQYLIPRDIQELCKLLRKYPEARLVAGGTDLSLEITQGLKKIETLIDILNVPQMNSIYENNGHIVIGAAVSYSAAKATLVNLQPHLTELIERFGSMQIRNRGTLGGNIANASPVADMPPVLIALNANITLMKMDSERTIPLEDFYTGYKKTQLMPQEFIKDIQIPLNMKHLSIRAYKVSKRIDDDISSLCLAISIVREEGLIKEARIAYGGMAEVPKRAKICEKSMLGKAWSESTIEDAMTRISQDFSPISDFRASAGYRLSVARNLLKRYFLEENGLDNEKFRVTHYAS